MMAKICDIDGEKIGLTNGAIKLTDGIICKNHFMQAGFEFTVGDILKAKKITLTEIKEAILNNKNLNSEKFNAISNTTKLETIEKQFKDAGVSAILGTRKEVSALPDILGNDEVIKYATSGFVDGNTILMLCTTERVLFIDKGLVYGIKSTEIPLDMINSVNYEKGMLLGSISIVNGAKETKVKNVLKGTAPKMVEVIKAERKAFMKPEPQTVVKEEKSIADQLHELKTLVDEGILTQDEFDAKKKQLLGI